MDPNTIWSDVLHRFRIKMSGTDCAPHKTNGTKVNPSSSYSKYRKMWSIENEGIISGN